MAKPEKEPENSGDTFRINSNLVAVPVSVTDANGEPMRKLRAEDFQLEEEGQAQQLQSLGEPGKTPLEMALLFDVSGSVRERFEFEKLAATRFLKEVLKPSDTVAVFSIGFDPKLVGERTGSVDKVAASLSTLEPTKEGTAFFDTVAKAAQYLGDHATPGARRVVVVISDGEDNHSETHRLADTQRELQRTDTLFYAINPSGPSIRLNKISMRGHNAMSTLAAETGGVAFLPDRDEELEKVFRQIAAELQAQYLLGYYSSNETNDGKFRRIKIQLPTRPDLRIRARQGYYAPKD
ncbi:MAG: VWA domain-containing protein [Acidobacteria bacterium]|nr:VWA domain-containing protein [Acidobacteriota bacterium]MBI3426618.1 VWA domain-containing protein [Acidobacteriota bacterium]